MKTMSNVQSSFQLGVSKSARPSPPSLPFQFYSAVHSNETLPPVGTMVVLAGNSACNAQTYVDDQVVLKINGTVVFSFDYSQGNSGAIIPLDPVDITAQLTPYLGQTVTIEIDYIDLYPGSEGASEFWLCFIS